MKNKKQQSSGGCLWLFVAMVATVITVTLVTLKLTDQTQVSWWLVFSPILLVIGVPTLFFLGLAVYYGIFGKGGEESDD